MEHITQNYLNIIRELNKKLDSVYKDQDNTEIENIFARSLKLNEEVGELNTEVLHKFYKRRESEFSQDKLEDEFADVMGTLLILADYMKVDINKAIANKLLKIKNRGGI